MAKILIMTICVAFSKDSAPNSPELSLLKFFPLTYHHSHFLAATLDSHLFHNSLLAPAHFFTVWLILD